MKFSIIVPAYNIEDYLETCVESVVMQTYPSEAYEVLVIDDGAKDRTPQVADDLASRYEQVRVIHQENGGLSEARNTGIRAARGDYILFLDGDDFWTDKQFLRKLDQLLGQTSIDVIFFAYSYYYGPDKTLALTYQLAGASGDFRADALGLAQADILSGPVWNKCIRRDLFDDSLLFVKGLLSEDLPWNAALYQKVETYAILNHAQLMYRQNREGSITQTVGEKNVWDILKGIDLVLSERVSQTDQVQHILHAFLATSYVSVLPFVYPYLHNGEIKDLLFKYKYLLQYRKGIGNPFFKVSASLTTFLGLRVSTFLLNKLLPVYHLIKKWLRASYDVK